MLRLVSSLKLIMILLLLVGCTNVDAEGYRDEAMDPGLMTEVVGVEPTDSEAQVIEKVEANAIDTRPFLSEMTYVNGIRGEVANVAFDYDPVTLSKPVRGVIIPHHNVANVLIADAYRAISEEHEMNPYDLIMVISPNHFSVGSALQVGFSHYRTYSGLVSYDHKLAEAIEVFDGINPGATAMLEQEHGQLVHMPYIDHYFEDVSVISLALGHNGNDEALMALAAHISEVIEGRRVLFVGSIDFSHYLTLDEAGEKDLYTRELLLNNDATAMYGLSDAYLDSPGTYLLMMALMRAQGPVTPNITNQSNSALIMRLPPDSETTSYFQIFYH